MSEIDQSDPCKLAGWVAHSLDRLANALDRLAADKAKLERVQIELSDLEDCRQALRDLAKYCGCADVDLAYLADEAYWQARHIERAFDKQASEIERLRTLPRPSYNAGWEAGYQQGVANEAADTASRTRSELVELEESRNALRAAFNEQAREVQRLRTEIERALNEQISEVERLKRRLRDAHREMKRTVEALKEHEVRCSASCSVSVSTGPNERLSGYQLLMRVNDGIRRAFPQEEPAAHNATPGRTENDHCDTLDKQMELLVTQGHREFEKLFAIANEMQQILGAISRGSA